MRRHIVTILFVCLPFVAIAFLPYQVRNTYGIYAYLAHEWQIISQYILLAVVGFIAITAFVYYRGRKEAKRKRRHVPVRAGIMTMIGLLIGYPLLILIAFIELNIMALVLNVNPHSLGVVTDRQAIVQRLTELSAPPEIITSQLDAHDMLIAVAVASSGKQTFYGEYVLKSIPSQAVAAMNKPNTSIVLLDDALVISEVNAPDMQAIGPVMGYLLVQDYFSLRPIKSFPRVAFLERDAYVQHRKQDARTKLVRVNASLEQLTKDVAATQAAIVAAEQQISGFEETIKKATADRTKQYNTCISEGSFQEGKFQRKNTSDFCRDQRNEAKSEADQFQKRIKDNEDRIKQFNAQLEKHRFYATFLQAQHNILQSQTARIPHEYGLFEPANTINIVLNKDSSDAVADYFATLTHEYLHYASFKATDIGFYSSFFEEGLTEYFARKAIEDNLKVSTNLAYPVQVKIIQQMMRRIPEVDFADMYFDKDEERLKLTMDLVYGEGFYGDMLIVFEQLQYARTIEEAMTYANTIMKRIGSQPLVPQDFLSSYSTFE